MASERDLAEVDPEIWAVIRGEIERQQNQLELIAAENFVSEAVLVAQGSVLTNKYAEGYPDARYYAGCEKVDVAEKLAVARAKQIFGADHANVQPHSGTQANMAILFAALEPGDTILGLDLAHGGHLSHGATKSFSGKLYKSAAYGVDRETEQIDMDNVHELAIKHKPKMIITGASAYPRFFDFPAFEEIAKEVGAYFLVDIAHVAGMVSVDLHPNPVPHADFVTTTTHKTMRGPRGGIILCKKEHAAAIDSQVFPGIQGGPMMHTIAGKAVALKESMAPGFKEYQQQILSNAQAMVKEMKARGYRIVSDGTDNHLFLVDLRSRNITGQQAETAMHEAGITTNKNLIPFDPRSAKETSGIRIGTPAVTTRGMKEKEMVQIVDFIDRVLCAPDDAKVARQVRNDVEALCAEFLIYSNLLACTRRTACNAVLRKVSLEPN